MERKFGQLHTNNTWREIARKFSQGLRDTGNGVTDVCKGIFEVVNGGVKGMDGVALGLGAFAILVVGLGGGAPLWAMVSREKNFLDTGKEIFVRLSNNPNLARVVGYPLLFFAVAGGSVYSYFRLTEK